MSYRWQLVWALFVILTFTSGLGFYNHAILIQVLAETGRFTVTEAAGGVSVFFLVSGLSGLVIAPLLERLDVRLVIMTGGLIAGTALIAIGRVATLPGLYLTFMAFGAGFAASGLLPATTLIARWFHAERARALSVASTGLSVGGILVTPLCAVLVAELALPQATLIMAAAYCLGVVPAALVLRSWPPTTNETGEPLAIPAATGFSFRAAVATPFFWTLSISYVFVMAAQVGGIAHQYGVAASRLTPADAAVAVAILPACSVVGRLAGGFMLDRVPTLAFTIVMMLLQALALALVAMADAAWLLYAGLGLFGITVGNLLMLQPLIVAEFFGLKGYTQTYAWSNLITQVGVASGPAVLGLLVALDADYGLAYWAAAASGIVAAIVFVLRRPAPMPTTQVT